MKIVFLTMVFMGMCGIGCARVRVEGPKEPIKLDITMRLDVYQHVAKDIDDIESIVNGPAQTPKKSNGQSLLHYFIAFAYAQDGLSPEVENAALRRRDRRQELVSWEAKGVIGENKSGLTERKDTDPGVNALVSAENSDRMVIYQAVANKNGTSVLEVQELYAKRLQNDAPAGTPIEIEDELTGKSAWKIK